MREVGQPFFGVQAGEKVDVYIDGQNLFAQSRGLNFDVDYKKLRDALENQCYIRLNAYFIAMPPDDAQDDYTPLKPLVDFLDYNGYTIYRKALHEFFNQNGERKVKSSVTADITAEMVNSAAARFPDHILLFASDSDLVPAVRMAQRHGVKVTVISSLHSDHRNFPVSDALRREANRYIDLKTLQPFITRVVTGERLPISNERRLVPPSASVRVNSKPEPKQINQAATA